MSSIHNGDNTNQSSVSSLNSTDGYNEENPQPLTNEKHSKRLQQNKNDQEHGHKGSNQQDVSSHNSRTNSFHDSFSAISLDSSNSNDNNEYNNNINNADDEPNQNPVALTSTINNKTQTNTSVLTNKSLRRPRKERRGLLAQFSIIPEFKDARQYPGKLKYTIVFMIAFSAMIGPMGTSIILPAIEDIKSELNTTTMRVNIAVGIYLLSLGVFPLWWSAFSEKFGRRSVYVVSFTLYTAFGIGCALAPNINTLIGMRVLSGGCSASVQSVGAGTIADIYAPEQRGRSLGYYYLGPLMAPLVSPIIGSLLLTRWSWRSTQWFLVILAFALDLMVIFLLPETLRTQDNKALIRKILADRRVHKVNNDEESNNVNHQHESTTNAEKKESESGESEEQGISTNNARQMVDDEEVNRVMSRVSMRNESEYDINGENQDPEALSPDLFRVRTSTNDPRIAEVRQNDLERMKTEIEQEIDSKPTRSQIIRKNIYEYSFKPLKSIIFLRYPPVALAISFSAISFGVLYLVNMTIEYEYARPPYNWKSLYVGFAYIPNSVTYIIASIYGGKWTDLLLKKDKEKNGYYTPESRISWNIFSAVLTFPIALLIIGWCFHYHTQWVTPLVGTALFGYSSMMTIGPVTTYLVDSLPGRGATGVALNNFVRMILATVAVFVSEPLIKGLNTGPMFTIFAGVVFLWAIVLVIIKKKGTYWRENYDLQKLYDSLD